VKANGELVAGLIVHLLLLGAPGIAAALYALRRGVREVPIVLAIALATSGVVAFVSFWAYYASPAAGQAWDFLWLLGSIFLAARCWRAGDLDRDVLRQLSVPLALWVLGSCFVVFLGFLHGGTDHAIPMSALRFSGQLPSDNDIPRFFSEWFATHGHTNPPPEYPGEWLMSDRPPLQVGYVLSQRAFFHTERELHYEIICVCIQCFWIIGMWAVLLAARVRRLTRSLATFAAMVSDIAILHGFFVWPKLIAAAFLLGALAIVISPAWSRQRHNPWVGALIGALLALAMLSHGSSAFGVIPLILLAAWRGLPSWRWLGVAVLAGLALMAPWAAYQHYADPPGNRLLKWQLGGDTVVDSKGTLEAIEDGYSEAGLGETLENKEQNFDEMIGWPRLKNDAEAAVDDLEAGKPGLAGAAVRDVRFFSIFPLLGILLVGPLAMIFAALTKRRRDGDDWRFALVGIGFFVVACLTWGLLLFGSPDSRATIHVGSLAVPLIGIVACVAGLRACFPRLAAWVVGANVLLVLALYVPSLTPEPGTSYSPLTALLAAASLAGFAWFDFRGPGRPSPPSGTAPARPLSIPVISER
jgi:MFS family permease